MPANQIIHDIWIGDLEDTKVWEGNIICVLETRPESLSIDALHIPILTLRFEKVMMKDKDGKDTDYMTHAYVDRALKVQLDAVAHIIQNHIDAKEKLLVSCGAGMERSPLAVTWYIHTRLGLTLEDAFELVKAKRPQAQNRLEWLNSEKNKYLEPLNR